MSFDPSFSGADDAMMRYIEDQGLQSDELHEEMENLMVKMMSVELDEAEANRMVELMNQYPGPMGMMMGRMNMMQSDFGNNWDQNMMNRDYGLKVWAGAWMWFIFLSVIVWLIVCILAAIWLWKQIQKK